MKKALTTGEAQKMEGKRIKADVIRQEIVQQQKKI